jgi:C4-dicarboxylate transporter
MGITPATLIVAITSGWALSGATSPFTASTTLVAAIGGVSASHVGTRWNGPYALICGLALSFWIMFFAYVL